MRPHYIFLLMAASQRGNAGPCRRDLDLDMFGSGDLGMELGSTVPLTDNYGSDLALFNAPATDSSETGDFNSGGSSDYSFALDETGSDTSLGDWSLESPTLENPDTASSTSLDPFGSDYLSDSGCSSNTMVSGKARRDESMCANTNGVRTPTLPKPKLPELPDLEPVPPPKIPDPVPGLPPVGPNKDPDWLKFYPKPEPVTPNQIADPRFDTKPEEPAEVVPSTDIAGPCGGFGTKYLCCELYGQPPPVMSDKPIEECVKCM